MANTNIIQCDRPGLVNRSRNSTAMLAKKDSVYRASTHS